MSAPQASFAWPLPSITTATVIVILGVSYYFSWKFALYIFTLYLATVVYQIVTRPAPLPPATIAKRVAVTRDGFLASKIPSRVDAIVIGSGVGSLYTAAFLAKLGKAVLVLEQHYIAGGATHAFEENGFEYDTGVHIVNNPGVVDKLLAPVASKKLDWCIMGNEKDGHTHEKVVIGTDTEFPCRKSTFFADLKAAFPADALGIERLRAVINQSQAILGADLVCKTLPKLCWRLVKNLAFPVSWWRSVELPGTALIDEYVKDKKLQAVLLGRYGDIGGPPSHVPLALNVALAEAFAQDGGAYPIGGPSVFAEALIPTIEAAGGRVLVRAPVEKILLEGMEDAPAGEDGDASAVAAARATAPALTGLGPIDAAIRALNPLAKKYKAVGVRVKGQNVYAPLVISGAGAWNTYARMLPRAVVQPWGYLEQMKTAQPSVSHVYAFIGLDGEQSELNLPSCNYWHMDVSAPDYDVNTAATAFFNDPLNGPLCFFYGFPSAKDPTYADRHEGKSNCLCFAETSIAAFERWAGSAQGRRDTDYEEYKSMIGERMVQKVLERHPELKDRVVATDYATPLTNVHYLGSEHGESLGVRLGTHRLSSNAMDFLRPDTPIEGLYLSGQDAAIPGVFGAMLGGLLCGQVVMSAADAAANAGFVGQMAQTYVGMMKHFVQSKKNVV